MRKRILIATGVVAGVMGLSASGAMAAPSDPAGEDAFVCPVLKVSDQAVAATGGPGERFDSIGDGEYTFGPGNAGSADTFNGNVPLDATNGDGFGTPGDDHVSPGEDGYSAIWSGEGT
jgi:hypothetical protein